MDGHGGGGGGDQLDRCRLPPQSQHQSGQTLGIEEIEANRPAGSCGYVSLIITDLASVFMTSSMCLCLATIRSRHRPSSGSVLLQSSKYFPAVYQIFSPVDGVVADLLRGVEDGGEGGDEGGEA